MKTTLLRGKVKVSNRKGQLVLSPGEQAVCLEEEIEKCEVDARAVAAWVDGTFEFENMSLGEITDQLGRWYDVDFVFADQQLKAITLRELLPVIVNWILCCGCWKNWLGYGSS